jgi:hypothetical protein
MRGYVFVLTSLRLHRWFASRDVIEPDARPVEIHCADFFTFERSSEVFSASGSRLLLADTPHDSAYTDSSNSARLGPHIPLRLAAGHA